MDHDGVNDKDFILATPQSDFRSWCNALWQEHKTEVFNWTNKPVNYTSQQFFSKNKWYIKSLYKSKGKDRWEF